jgi:hypothetical protein
MTEAWEYYGEPEPFEILAATSKFFQVAAKADERFGSLPAYDRAIQLIPLEAGGKRPASGFLPSKHNIPKTHEALALMAAAYPDANVGIRSRRAVGSIVAIDCDEPGVVERIERETGRRFPLTYTTQTRPYSAPYKKHHVFISTEHSVHVIKKQTTDVTHICGYDLKGCGGFGYIAAEGCVRDGEPIVALHDVPIIPIPDWLVDWLVADVAKARAMKREIKKSKPAPKPETTTESDPPVARIDRHWVIQSRIRTWKNTGISDDDIFDLLTKHIRLYFEDGEQMLTPSYLRKLRSMIRKVSTLGETSYRNLTHHRRRRRRTSIPLATVRERFKSCPPDISMSEARRLFSVQSPADDRRLIRQFHEHGYVSVGAQGSHARVWSRSAAAATLHTPKTSLTTKKPSSSITIDSHTPHTSPHHKKVSVRKSVQASGGGSASYESASLTILTDTRNGEQRKASVQERSDPGQKLLLVQIENGGSDGNQTSDSQGSDDRPASDAS